MAQQQNYLAQSAKVEKSWDRGTRGKVFKKKKSRA